MTRMTLGLVLVLTSVSATNLEAQADLTRFVSPIVSELRDRSSARFEISLDVGAVEDAHAETIRKTARDLNLPAVSLGQVMMCPDARSRITECTLPNDNSMVVRFGEPVVDGDLATLSFEIFGQSGAKSGVHRASWRAELRLGSGGEWTLVRLMPGLES